MAKNQFNVTEWLESHHQVLQKTWSEEATGPAGLAHAAPHDEFAGQITALLEAFLACLREDEPGKESTPATNRLQDRVVEFVRSRSDEGAGIDDILDYFRAFKEALVRLAEETVSPASRDFLREWQRLDRLMDRVFGWIYEAGSRQQQAVIDRQNRDLDELSTPVIQVWDGVLTLPIIGTLDSARTEKVMENLLQTIVQTGAQIAILDISGVPTVDTLVAQHLMKTVSAARLMGADCIISGIRPEIAQTMVQLGLDLSYVRTKATLAEALKQAMAMLGYTVVRPSEKA